MDDLPSPEAPVIITNRFSSNDFIIWKTCASRPRKKIASSSVKGLNPGYGDLRIIVQLMNRIGF